MSEQKKRSGVKQFAHRVERKSELIEVVIPPNTVATLKTKIQLPDNQNLRNTHFLGCEVFHFADFPKSILTRQTVIDLSVLKTIFITFQAYNGKNFIWQDPAICYHNNGTVVETFPNVMAAQKVNYPKSYIEIADTSVLSITEAQVLLMRIFYSEFEAVEKKDAQAGFRNQS